jgi:hypothetical protein
MEDRVRNLNGSKNHRSSKFGTNRKQEEIRWHVDSYIRGRWELYRCFDDDSWNLQGMPKSRWQQSAFSAKIWTNEMRLLTRWTQRAVFIFHSQWGFEYKPRWITHIRIPRKRANYEARKTNGVIKTAKNKKRSQLLIIHDHNLSWYDTVMKRTKSYKHLRVSYSIHILYLLHVSATLVAIVREMDYKGNIIKVFETTHRCQIGSNILYRIFCSALPWGWPRV